MTRQARRETFERDGLQCSFIGENGERCPERSFLEIDHVTARARGGSGEADNLRVFCRAHNRDAAERVFGRAHVEARIRRARKRSARRLDCDQPSAGAANFSQRKSGGAGGAKGTVAARASIAAASPPAIGDLALAANQVAPQTDECDARKHLRTALLTLGFRAAEADDALLVIDRSQRDRPWRRSIETLVREALTILT